jgi:hypothetical protein
MRGTGSSVLSKFDSFGSPKEDSRVISKASIGKKTLFPPLPLWPGGGVRLLIRGSEEGVDGLAGTVLEGKS